MAAAAGVGAGVDFTGRCGLGAFFAGVFFSALALEPTVAAFTCGGAAAAGLPSPLEMGRYLPCVCPPAVRAVGLC